jgi:hypothetical protein
MDYAPRAERPVLARVPPTRFALLKGDPGWRVKLSPCGHGGNEMDAATRAVLNATEKLLITEAGREALAALDVRPLLSLRPG